MRSIRNPSAILLCLAAGLIILAGPVLGISVGANQRVAGPSGQWETTIAVHLDGATGVRTAVIGAIDGAPVGGDSRTGCGVYRATAAAATPDIWSTWSAGFVPGTSRKAGGMYGYGADPVVSVDGAGNFYYACIGLDFFSPYRDRLTVSRLAAGTTGWSAPVEVDHGSVHLTGAIPQAGVGAFADKPDLLADRDNGNVYIAWQVPSGKYREPVLFSRSTNGGGTFSRPLAVSPGDATQVPYGASLPNFGASMGESADGHVYVVFLNLVTSMIWIAASEDDGATFPYRAPIAAWTGIPGALSDTTFRVNALPQLVVNRVTGDLFVTWPASGGDVADVFLIRSTDDGRTWSVPVCVGDCGTGTAQFFPAIEAAPDGSRLDLAYYTCHSTTITSPCSGGLLDERYVRIDFDGTGAPVMAAPVTVNDGGAFAGSFFIGDYNGIASLNDRAYPVWLDTRNSGDPDVYMAAIIP